ncbi:SOS response-associated peptidase [Roseibacterium sp. SDUM158016]|jgi:putative SOS response-associated peptidase YedK|uniref:SOS response-associated peptidase n=1 Tax=Roseicyclus sediminis TaxID=2980997 RepID=UPI0021D1900D|nr:SOS response-associated peptidase [Roseibacterium sp. SDUM158016]MCU4654990.1 SOS response-associated peptidase [Roseibacterium sp. SDUM158016]
MCGRMTMTHPSDAMARLFDAAPSNDLPEVPRYNICPTQAVAVVTADGGSRRLRPMRWGFLPHWYKTPTDGPLLINARAETIAEKPAFRAACRERRCLVPVTGFYEWTKGEDGARLPWYFTPADGSPLVLAGVWQDWSRGEDAFTTLAIVTTAASPWMAETHHREPVSLAPEDWAKWLGEEGHGAATLMQAAPEGRYARWRVDPRVNSNRAQGPELIEPIAA